MLTSRHISDLLIAGGFVAGGANPTDWNVWIGSQPISKDRAISIYDASALAPNPKWLLDYPAVQVKCRGSENDYEAAYNKLSEVKDLLLGVPSYTANNGDRIVMIVGIGDIAFVGRDANRRPEFVTNYRVTIQPAVTPNTHRESLDAI